LWFDKGIFARKCVNLTYIVKKEEEEKSKERNKPTINKNKPKAKELKKREEKRENV